MTEAINAIDVNDFIVNYGSVGLWDWVEISTQVHFFFVFSFSGHYFPLALSHYDVQNQIVQMCYTTKT